MPAKVSSFGTIALVRDISSGSVFILPTSEGTAIAMKIHGTQIHEARYIAWLSEPPNTHGKRFSAVDEAHFAGNKALIVDDAVFVLSAELSNISAWETQQQPGTVIRTEKSNIIIFAQKEIRTTKSVDLATGILTQQPDDSILALAYSSWSLVRRYADEGGANDNEASV